MKKKLNIITLIVIILLLMGGCLNKPEIDKTHILQNEEINPYFIIIGTPHNVLNFQGDKEIVNTYNIYVNIVSLINSQINNIRYEVNTTNYVYEKETIYNNLTFEGDSTPIFKNIVNNINVGGNGYRQIYGKLIYEHQKTKEINFYEEIIMIIDKDISVESYIDGSISDLYNLSINLNENQEYYNTVFSIKFNNTFENHHLDIQTWLIDKYGQVYPFIGVYNYYIKDDINLSTNNYIYKDIDFQYIYVRSKYWNDLGELYNNNYRIDLKELIDSLTK